MKKFQFSLDSVLSYKQQVQDVLQGEHAEIMLQVRAQEELLNSLWVQYRACNEEYKHQCETGLPITEVLIYQGRLRSMEQEIQRATALVDDLHIQEENKRNEVVEAKRDTSSIEKLKDKKLKDYQKAVGKSEEAFIEEFVSGERVRGIAI